MGSYTAIDVSVANRIMAQYGKGEVRELEALSLGISNSNYKVTTADETILLKISNDKNRAQLEDEQRILHYLAKKYQYSLTPHLTLRGKLVYEEGLYFGVLYPFVEGIPPGPSDLTCSLIGRALGELHALDKCEQMNTLRSHEDVGYDAGQIINYIESSTCPKDFKEMFHECFPDGLAAYLEHPHRTNIIHGDLYYDNTLFYHEKVAAVLDFEQGGVGPILLDLGISISGTCLEKGRLITPLIHSYLRGYEEVMPLTASEKALIPDAIALGLFSIALWRIKRFKEGNLNPLMADSYRELLARALHLRANLQQDPL